MPLYELGGESPRAQICERLLRFLAGAADIDARNSREAPEPTAQLAKILRIVGRRECGFSTKARRNKIRNGGRCRRAYQEAKRQDKRVPPHELPDCEETDLLRRRINCPGHVRASHRSQIAATIRCAAFPAPNGPSTGIGPWSNCRRGRRLRSLKSFGRRAPSLPAMALAPSRVSSHSVSLRSVMHGQFTKYASFCKPPESVSTQFAPWISASMSRYPSGSITLRWAAGCHAIFSRRTAAGRGGTGKMI